MTKGRARTSEPHADQHTGRASGVVCAWQLVDGPRVGRAHLSAVLLHTGRTRRTGPRRIDSTRTSLLSCDRSHGSHTLLPIPLLVAPFSLPRFLSASSTISVHSFDRALARSSKVSCLLPSHSSASMSASKGKVLIVLTSATPTMADGAKSGYYWSASTPTRPRHIGRCVASTT